MEWDEIPRPVQLESNQTIIVDDAIAEHFPPGSKVKNTRSQGASFWTRTVRIDIELPDKTQKAYFLKVSTGELVYSFLARWLGAPTGRILIHISTCPSYMDMIEELPDIRKFSAILAKLHHQSVVDKDAPKEFGFHVMTHEVSQGPSKELDQILPELISKVIPRLLRPLETHGRTLKPVALHGDIWHGNLAVNANTGEPVYFDPSVFWGHNEYDVGSMATPRYGPGQDWIVEVEYHKFFPLSVPEEDHEARNALYAISGHFCASTLYPDNKTFRKM
ncbi:Fructosamine/Ketosamine-3-kinase [Metarhizium guizhouense ARSEF 977]|uniref:protein-ribulosamine 3-kinase n=1 Tax=Metarhizium guizhouense (strain ARSEF 977) TaxID=1276136 RepID=A0A0B4I7M0_METGA|nr:Fructosamine/Ketosamine-3-kinase [Metarhizium guizhouense ARSEF 977]